MKNSITSSLAVVVFAVAVTATYNILIRLHTGSWASWELVTLLYFIIVSVKTTDK